MRWQAWVSAATVLLGGCFRCHHDDTDAGPGTDGPPDCVEGETECSLDRLGVATCVGGGLLYTPCDPGEACADDAGGGAAGCVLVVCEAGAILCEGNSVVECLPDGSGTTLVETCADEARCVLGACISLCERAALFHEPIGCEFFALDTDNVSNDDPLPFEVTIANPDATNIANVVVEVRTAGSWTSVDGDMIAPRTLRVFSLADRHVEGTALTTGLAYRITSSIPVSALQMNSADVGGASVSSGASRLLATPALGQSYWTMSLPTSTGDDALLAFGGEVHHSGFAVVGAVDGTSVTVTASTSTLGAAGIPALAAGDSYEAILNAGDVLQLEAGTVGDDVSGSSVIADQPVAVFGYHECASTGPAPSSCDHIEEELLPMEYVGALGPLSYACARTFEGSDVHVWRFLAAEDATTVTIEYSGALTGLPASGTTVMLNQGNWVEYWVDGPTSPGSTPTSEDYGDFFASSDKPVLVFQFASDEPSMAAVGNGSFGVGELLMPALPGFTDEVTLTHFAGTPYPTLDGAVVGAGLWSATGGGMEVYRAALSDGAHLLEAGMLSPGIGNSSLGVTLAGRGASNGYMTLGGLGPRCTEGDDIVCM